MCYSFTSASTTLRVVDGPARPRRSHRFPADKDEALMTRAVHASLDISPDRQAKFRIVNDRVGHHFPSGGNWLSVRLEARDRSVTDRHLETKVIGCLHWSRANNEERRAPCVGSSGPQVQRTR
jgi:hypothetical protein